MLTLTAHQIKELAEFAGMEVTHDDDELMESEYTIVERPTIPFRDEVEGAKNRYYQHAAYLTDYPEEGALPLGPEIEPPRAAKCEAEGGGS